MEQIKKGNEPSLILQLNNYIYNQQVIDDVLEFKTTGKVPEHIKPKSRFVRKWTPFYIANNHFIYRPNNLTVIIDPNEKQEAMKRLFDDERTGVGSGIAQFYHIVCSKYLNIKAKEVADFLKRQKVYQMSRNTKHKINKPILASVPNERWAIDLVDMNRYEGQNRHFRYILTCIDYYSRYVWATPLKNKESHDVALAMESICRNAGVYPHILQKDNGGEFQGETNTFMERHNIKWINTLSYSPQSNGLIENFNNKLRKMLREIMIRNENLVWFNKLDLCCSIKNRQKNSTTKRRPIDIWNNTRYEEQDKRLHLPASERIRLKAKENVGKNKTREFNAGDYVRVKLSQLYSQVRKMVKDGDKKYIVVKYSPEIYQIDKVLKPDNEGYEKLRYTLKNLDDTPLLTQQKMNNPDKPREQKRFFASDFMKVEKKDIPNDVRQEGSNFLQRDGFDIHKALKLNVIQDEETEARKPQKERTASVPRESTPIPLREPSSRIRRPNQMLQDYDTFNNIVRKPDNLQPTPPPKKSNRFVILGGVKHYV